MYGFTLSEMLSENKQKKYADYDIPCTPCALTTFMGQTPDLLKNIFAKEVEKIKKELVEKNNNNCNSRNNYENTQWKEEYFAQENFGKMGKQSGLRNFEFDVTISANDDEMGRIGFSIIQWIDGVTQVNTVSNGTPADRSGLSVGDEIIGVNDWTTEGKTHEEVVEHVQTCIKTRMIQLKVRRKIDDSIGTDLKLGLARVSEAFLVSVNKEHVKDVMNKLTKKYPDTKVIDMETIARPSDFAPNGTASGSDSTERLKMYENDVIERREKRLQRQKENEFLRSSLRSSKKLRSLENKTESIVKGTKEMTITDGLTDKGYTNESFQSANTSLGEESKNNGHANNNDDAIALKQVIVSVDRIASHLASLEGREEEGKLLKEYFQSEPVRKAIEVAATHKEVVKEKSPSTEPAPPNAESSFIDREINGRIVREITIYKDPDSYLGATVRNDDDRVIVGRVVKGGIIERSEVFKEGDELLEMNSVDLRGKTIAEVCEMLRTMSGEIRFLVAPCESGLEKKAPTYVQHLRALFDYDPEDDVYVPCKELALKFHRGDILHVINTSDENWWQAFREGDDTVFSLAGLVPSSSFHQQVVLYTEELEKDARPKTRKDARKRLPEVIKTLRRKKSNEMKPADEAGIDTASGYHSDLLTYEDVVLHLALADKKRPLVLCGPEGVGCLEMRKRLLEMDKEGLAGPIPHTTRAPLSGEINGVHYNFVTKSQFQEDVRSGSFLEWGEYEKHLYGTSIRELKSVIRKGKTCVLTLRAESLNAIRTSSFMPFIVFISPPSLTVLRRQKETERALHAERTQTVRDEDLKGILSQGKLIEQKFGHLFDHIIVNMDFDRSLQELKTIVKRIETEPQWIPAAWLQTHAM